MSFNRENVCWQSRNGKWTLAFYECFENPDCEDPEWDVSYGDGFEWVSAGHASFEAAENSWHGANPGGGEVIEWSETNAMECERLDAKAEAYNVQKRATKTSKARGW